MALSKVRMKVLLWNVSAAVLFTLAVVWNIRAGGNYNLEIAVGALVLGIIKLWSEFFT